MILYEETRRLEPAIRVLHRTIFGREDESNLVDALRTAGLVTVSLAAEEEGRVVGHILFSDVRMETQNGPVLATALAPVAVLAEWRRRGIASTLIREGMELCRERGKSVVFVLGDPKLYRRFGFSSALVKNLQSPYSSLGEHWMAAELQPGALRDTYGLVRYPDAFRAL